MTTAFDAMAFLDELMAKPRPKPEITATKQVRVVDADAFEANVFGGHCFLSYYPDITTKGITVGLMNSRWYVLHENGMPVNSDGFFTKKEMKYLEEIKADDEPQTVA
ncbi:hypothetical protein [Pseudomonas phage D6]|nr:hypothetical protein [Pseudomonas phage D6]